MRKGDGQAYFFRLSSALAFTAPSSLMTVFKSHPGVFKALPNSRSKTLAMSKIGVLAIQA